MAKDTGKVLIHGKTYETVASRVSRFKKDKPDLCIITELLFQDQNKVIMRAAIRNQEGTEFASGHAEEVRSTSTINRTSALENCETSAIGRALAAFGMAGTEFASADEVASAIKQQNNTESFLEGMATNEQRLLISKMMGQLGIPLEDHRGYLNERFGVDTPLTSEAAGFVIKELRDQSKQQPTQTV